VILPLAKHEFAVEKVRLYHKKIQDRDFNIKTVDAIGLAIKHAHPTSNNGCGGNHQSMDVSRPAATSV
jgi:hypothetical protein